MRFAKPDVASSEAQWGALEDALAKRSAELAKRVSELFRHRRAFEDGIGQHTLPAAVSFQLDDALELAAEAHELAGLMHVMAGELTDWARSASLAAQNAQAELDNMSAEDHVRFSRESAEQGILHSPPYAATQYLNQWHDDSMVTMNQIVEFTSVSESTIDRLIERGDFPSSVRIGERRVAWRWGDVRQKMFKLVDDARERDRQRKQLYSR